MILQKKNRCCFFVPSGPKKGDRIAGFPPYPLGRQKGSMNSSPEAIDSFIIQILIENSINGLVNLNLLNYIPRPITKNLSSFN